MRKRNYKLATLVTAFAICLALVGCSNSLTNITIGEGTGTGKTISHGVHSYEAEEFSKLDIESDVMNVVIEQGSTSQVSIELITNEKLEHKMNYEVSLNKEVLNVKATHKKSYKQIRGERTLKVMLPVNEQLILHVNGQYGDVQVADATLQELDIYINVGEIELHTLTGDKFDIQVDTGNIEIVDVNGQLIVEADVGVIDIVGLGANVPIKVNNEVGDISVQFASELTDVAIDMKTSVGAISSSNKELSKHINKNQLVTTIGTGQTKIDITTDVGNINIK